MLFELWAFLCDVYTDGKASTRPTKIAAFAQAANPHAPTAAEQLCAALPCVLTSAGTWIKPVDLVVLYCDGKYLECPNGKC